MQQKAEFMGREESKRENNAKLKAISEKKEKLAKEIKLAEDLAALKSLPEFESLKKIYKDVEEVCLKRLCEVAYKDRQGNIVYITPNELQLRQRLYNGIISWNNLIDEYIKIGNKASEEMKIIKEDEQDTQEELSRQPKERTDFN